MRADIVVDMQRRVLLTVALLQPFSSGSFLGHTECDFPVVFNRAEELERFSSCRGRTPVLLRGFMNEWWPHNLSIEAFTEMYGDYQVKVSCFEVSSSFDYFTKL